MAPESVPWKRSTAPLETAADLVAQALSESGERPRLAVSGGSAAAALAPLRQRLPSARWQALRLTWVDERRVPTLHAASNRGEAYRQGWLGPSARVGVEVPLWTGTESPAEAIRRVTRALDTELDGGLDVLLLGMGEDGHVASLFPGHAALNAPGPVALVDDSPKPPPERITLTLPILTTARRAVVVALGASKRGALYGLLDGDRSLPVVHLPHLFLVTDQDLNEPPRDPHR